MYVFSAEEIDVNRWRSKGSFWRLAFIFFGWGRVSLIFPFLSLSPISPWASWGRKLSYFNVHLGGSTSGSQAANIVLFTHWLISSAPLLGWGLCCSPPGQRRQSRESYVQTELVWKAVWTCTLCMHQESTQAMVSGSSSFFASHSNFSFSGGIENLSLVMYHILTAVTVVQ